MKVIEGLKGWMARAGGVNWTASLSLPAHTQTPGWRIVAAQLKVLVAEPDVAGDVNVIRWLARTHPHLSAETMAQADWQAIMNTLGARIRARKAAA